jgi:hypothetical protein
MPADFTTVFKAAHSEFVRGLSDETIKRRRILKELQSRGRVTFNHDGQDHDWRVRYREHDLDTYVDGAPVVFGRIDPYIQAVLPWRAYDMNTVVTKKEKLATRGKSAIFKLYKQKTKELRDDVRKKFNGKLWGSAGTADIHGAEEIFGATYASGSISGTANGTYAGIAQTLGANGGATVADPEYAFWTPNMYAWDASGWVGGQTFASNAGAVLRRGIIDTMQENDLEERVDCIYLAKQLFIDFLQYLDARDNIYTAKGGKLGPTTDAGFTAVIFDAVKVTWEFDIATNRGYGLNFDKMELMSMNTMLFDGAVEDDIDSKATKMDVDYFGNLKFESPRHFFKITTVATA